MVLFCVPSFCFAVAVASCPVLYPVLHPVALPGQPIAVRACVYPCPPARLSVRVHCAPGFASVSLSFRIKITSTSIARSRTTVHGHQSPHRPLHGTAPSPSWLLMDADAYPGGVGGLRASRHPSPSNAPFAIQTRQRSTGRTSSPGKGLALRHCSPVSRFVRSRSRGFPGRREWGTRASRALVGLRLRYSRSAADSASD